MPRKHVYSISTMGTCYMINSADTNDTVPHSQLKRPLSLLNTSGLIGDESKLLKLSTGNRIKYKFKAASDRLIENRSQIKHEIKLFKTGVPIKEVD